MIEQLNALETEAIDAVQVAADESSLRDLEVRFRQEGEITALLKGMRMSLRRTAQNWPTGQRGPWCGARRD